MPLEHLTEIIRLALAEDVGGRDLTTDLVVAKDAKAEAEITAKQDLVAAGLLPARLVFQMVDPELKFKALVSDGDHLSKGQAVVHLSGSAASILTAERTALNFLMHLSGVATLTAEFVKAVGSHRAKIVDTRKTGPGMRVLEKAAVRAGKGANHRQGLFDGILIKDNHIASAGSISSAVKKAKSGAPHTVKVEVEVVDPAGLEEAITAGADVVMLDNMTPNQMAEAVKQAGGRVLLEASGGIDLSTVSQVAATGVDIISVGALTHSAPAADMSLNFTLK